jgi:putative addiction module CopG family antidote
MRTLNISLPKSLRKFVDEQVSRGGYATASEYVRELIRRVGCRTVHDSDAHRAEHVGIFHNLVHGTPAGGCILTNEKTAERFSDLVRHKPDFDLEDFKLLAWGRHFRLSPLCKLIVGRDDPDNIALEKIASDADGLLYLPDNIPGPFGILCGSSIEDHVAKSTSLLARYTKFRKEKSCRVVFKYAGKEEVLEALPAADEECDRLRV